jgi:hypothetical protein
MERTDSVLRSMSALTAFRDRPDDLRRGPLRHPLPDRCLAVEVTIYVLDGRPLLVARVFARHCVDFLRALGTMTGTRVYAYCLLPDRARLLLGLPLASTVDVFVERWKGLCAREWRRRTHERDLWRPGYDARILSSTADLALARERVLDAAVREGLAPRREEYALAGTCPPP